MPDQAATHHARAAAPTGGAAALAAWRSGDTAAAEEAARNGLLQNPDDRSAKRVLGIIAYQAGRHAEALPLLRGVCDDAADHSNLGAVLRALGQHDEAEAAYRSAIALDAGFAAAHYNLGNLLHEQARYTDAAVAFRAAVEFRPAYVEAWRGLGNTLQSLGRPNEAVEAFRRAVQYAPDNAEIQNNLGTALIALECHEAAFEALQRAIALDQTHAAAHGNLGALLARCGHPIAAEAECRTAVALAPGEHRWLTNLGVSLLAQGRHAEAEACYRQGMALQPDYATGHGNLLFALGYRTDVAAEAIFAEYQDWDRRHAKHFASTAPPFVLDRTPGRRLRVGYVSPDFRQHAVALFAEPLLAAHDRSSIELYCYADVAVPDDTTERFRALADHWCCTPGMSDADLAETIRSDQIDVLVDLAGHSAGNRLLVFARRPAPVQVAYLLGHGYTTGLSAMDAFLADPVLTPDGADSLFSERIVRLPRIPLAYRATRRYAGRCAIARAGERLRHIRSFRPTGAVERNRHRRLGAHSARGPTIPPGAQQPAVPGSGISPPVPGAFRRARDCRGQARSGLHDTAATDLGRLWRDRHRARSVPAQCRHDDDRGTMAGRARRLPRWSAERRPLRRQHPACGRPRRLGRYGHRRLRGTRHRRGIRSCRAGATARRAAPALRSIAAARCGRPRPRHRGGISRAVG